MNPLGKLRMLLVVRISIIPLSYLLCKPERFSVILYEKYIAKISFFSFL